MKQTKVIILSTVLTATAIFFGFYLWRMLSPQTGGDVTNRYSDDYLSFEYPKGVDLLLQKPSGGRSDSQGIEFLVYDQETDSYRPTGLRLSYIVALGEGGDSTFENLGEVETFYLPYDLEMHTFTVDGRKALQVVTEDITGETFFVVIPANQSGDAYRFNGSFMSEAVQEILTSFVETAELKK